MTNKTLKDAVLDAAVKAFAIPPKPFSAYEVTQLLRTDVNAGRYTIDGMAAKGATFGQEIPHSVVRAMFEQLFRDNFFDRTFNGRYMEYTIGNINPPKVVAPVVVNTSDPTGSVYKSVVDALKEQNVTATITAQSKLDDDLGLDDLDTIEVLMSIEHALKTELKGNEISEPVGAVTVLDLYKHVCKGITKHAGTTAVTTTPHIPAPSPVQTKAERLRGALKGYITRNLEPGKGIKLKNAQKAVKIPGTSIREISSMAQSLGYATRGTSTVPFNQWEIVA